VKVLTKPQHGKLSNRKISTPITISRFGPVGKCYGKLIGGFEVYYTPAPGFRGSDQFSIELTWEAAHKHEIDSYVVTVQ
jgi:hypothetical protein